jgi:hypothetical protein
MRKKKPQIASLDQVKITRQDDYAVIEYADSSVSTVNFKIGPEMAKMTDQEILDCHNDCIRVRERMRAEYVHVAVEIPPGKPQIEYFDKGMQWVPRGGVLRCVITDRGPRGEPTIHIDDHDLSLHEFGRLLSTYGGWGMRITFVPDDELHEEPPVKVRDPADDR